MKIRTRHCLALLGINIVVELLATSAFLLYIFRGDAVLAAVPAALALPGILLQPWFALFLLMPYGVFYAPFITTLVSIPLYAFLDRKGMLDRAKRLLARLKKRRIILIIGGAIACLLAIGFARYVDFPAWNHGAPMTLQHSIQGMDLDLDSSRHYCLGSFIDSEWLWQARLSENDFHILAGRLRLHSAATAKAMDAFQHMPPYWWQPVISDQTRIQATHGFPAEGRGQDGWHALATWNPDSQILHLWIKDNF